MNTSQAEKDRDRQIETGKVKRLLAVKSRDIKHSLARFTGLETKVQIFRKHFLPPSMELPHIFGWWCHLWSVQRCSKILHFGNYHAKISFPHKEKFCRIALDSCEI